MKTFFESVVKDVLSQLTLDTTFFIIPNRRSKTFLKKEIIKSIKGTALSPNIISIDDFIELISEKKESPKTTQLFNLYEAYMSVSKKKDFDSYSSFRNWSNMLLNDINNASVDISNRFISVYPSLKKWPCLGHINNHCPNGKYTCYYQ